MIRGAVGLVVGLVVGHRLGNSYGYRRATADWRWRVGY